MCLALILFLSGVSETQAVSFPQPIGFAIISQENDWETQRESIRKAGAKFVRIPMTEGFGNTPSMVEDVVQDGVTHIALQTRACDISYENVYRDFIDQAFQIQVERYQNIQFYLEVGNEPDICGSDPLLYTETAGETVRRIRSIAGYANLRFVLGLGVHPEYNRDLLSNDTVLAEFDALAYHLYGHENLWDITAHYDFYRNELPRYGKPILLTEVGINGDIGDTIKAQRYREFALQQPPSTEAIAFWTTDHTWSESYWIDPTMAATMAGAECFSETGYCIRGEFATFWHSNGLEFGDPGVSYRESLLLHGYPLTDPFVHPHTGLVTQIFERSVMQLHPNNPDPYKVLLVHLGRVYQQCGEECAR